MELLIAAVDFDGTIVEDKYPGIGRVNEKTVRYIKHLKRNGYRLILWTCRSDNDLIKAVEFCRNIGIVFDAINDNLPEIKAKYQNNSRKIFANIYIDDRAVIPVEVRERKSKY